jgi:hypothetical protein
VSTNIPINHAKGVVMGIEKCPHCETRVMFLSDICPNCKSSKKTPTKAGSLKKRIKGQSERHFLSFLFKNRNIRKIVSAVSSRNLPGVSKLLRSGIDPNTKTLSFGEPLISIATKNGYFDMVELLLKAGADPNTEDQYTDTPLHLAARRAAKAKWRTVRRSEIETFDMIINLLIKYGADPEVLNEDEFKFPKSLIINYDEIDDITYPLMLRVCNPRGMESTDVHELFVGRCPICDAKMNSRALMQIGDVFATAKSFPDAEIHSSNPIPSSCPTCNEKKIKIIFNRLNKKEKTNLVKDPIFAKFIKL